MIPSDLSISSDLEESWSKKGSQHLSTIGTQFCLVKGMGAEVETEAFRQMVCKCVSFANEFKYTDILWLSPRFAQHKQLITALAESLILSNYQFLTYKSEIKPHALTAAWIFGEGDGTQQQAVDAGMIQAKATCIARDLVNEPVITLTAVELSRRIEELGKEFGFEVEVFHKQRIQALKMGGLLAVNTGSPDPPTFSILSYRPAGTEEMPPVILVGKGVVFDTGGLSLKPTANSMDFMKADMGGAAAVVGALCGIAALKLSQPVIGLIPATDNRPGGNAYVPGDVIKMFDGSTVEVLNTDAEGRMILADALAYAKKYEPALVIDLATLTGAAVVSVGLPGIAMMRNTDEATRDHLLAAGEDVYERMVEFPLWKEYGDMLQSDIADLKNIGGRYAGAITAGKFLEHFTDYPWIHLDIAGPSWLTAPDSYRGKNGTGVGVRLLIEFIANHYEQPQ
ncbi:MAG: leucyl aminopeptidase [Bacteroidota bacterium]